MVEAVDMMITAAHEMDMEAEKVTQAAEVMSTQVAVIVLEDKTGVFPHPWKGAIHLLVILTVVQAAEHPEVVAVVEADPIEVEAEADTKNTLKLLDQDRLLLKKNEKWKLFYLYYQRTTKRKSCFYLFLLLPVKFSPPWLLCFCEEKLNQCLISFQNC